MVSAAKKKQGKEGHSLTAGIFSFFFFQFSKKSLDIPSSPKDVVVSCDLLFLPSSYRRRRRRRRHVRPSGEPPARRRTGEGRDEEEEEAFFADGNDLESRGNRWFYRRKKVAFVCAAGEIVTNEGVVTRRATLGKRLTFLDVVSASKDEEGQRLYYLKVQKPNVTKRIRVGATVRFRGIEYKHDTTGKRGERTKGMYIETKDVPELLEMAPASMIVNARKF